MKKKREGILLFILASIFISGCLFHPGEDDTYISYDMTPPTAEVMGEEPPDVPKYEPSTRTEYHKMMYGEVSGYEMNIIIEYYTVDDPDRVSQFYLNQMPKYDWKLKYQDARIQEGYNIRIFNRELEYIKSDCSDEFCSPHLNINIESPEGKGYSLIHLFYDNSGIE